MTLQSPTPIGWVRVKYDRNYIFGYAQQGHINGAAFIQVAPTCGTPIIIRADDISSIQVISERDALQQIPEMEFRGIITIVAEHFATPKAALLGQSRAADIVLPRGIAMLLLSEFGVTHSRIAAEFRKSPSAISQNKREIKTRASMEPAVARAINELREKIREHFRQMKESSK